MSSGERLPPEMKPHGAPLPSQGERLPPEMKPHGTPFPSQGERLPLEMKPHGTPLPFQREGQGWGQYLKDPISEYNYLDVLIRKFG